MKLIYEATKALQLAMSNKKAIVLVVDGQAIAFESVRSFKVKDDGVAHVFGRVKGPITEVLPRELDHWVNLDLSKVSAIIDRDTQTLDRNES
jgi:hypothetical protein